MSLVARPKKPCSTCKTDRNIFWVVIAECYHFYYHSQGPEEIVSEFPAELRHLAIHCFFRNFLNDPLRDRLECGLRSEAMQRKLFSQYELTLMQAADIAKGMEAATRDSHKLQGQAASILVLNWNHHHQLKRKSLHKCYLMVQRDPFHMLQGHCQPANLINYAQLEKEALSLVYRVQNFHSYLFGRSFVLYKPFDSHNGLHKSIPPLAAGHLQRWALLQLPNCFQTYSSSCKCWQLIQTTSSTHGRLKVTTTNFVCYSSDWDFTSYSSTAYNYNQAKLYCKQGFTLHGGQVKSLKPYWYRQSESVYWRWLFVVGHF